METETISKKEVVKNICPICEASIEDNKNYSGTHNAIFINGYPSVCPYENEEYDSILLNDIRNLQGEQLLRIKKGDISKVVGYFDNGLIAGHFFTTCLRFRIEGHKICFNKDGSPTLEISTYYSRPYTPDVYSSDILISKEPILGPRKRKERIKYNEDYNYWLNEEMGKMKNLYFEWRNGDRTKPFLPPRRY